MELIDKVKGFWQVPISGIDPAGAGGGAIPSVSLGERHSNGLREMTSTWIEEQTLRVLDLGCTSKSNLQFLLERGHRAFNEDLLWTLGEADWSRPGENGPELDLERFFATNLQFEAASFDVILFWDLADFLPEPLVRPLVSHLIRLLAPGGNILAYFHTRDAGVETPFCRYHIRDAERVEMRSAEVRPLLRIFNNRHVENLFQGCRTIKFFLARDNLREVLVVK